MPPEIGISKTKAYDSRSSNSSPLWQAHRGLADYNKGRLSPRLPDKNWQSQLMIQGKIHALECQLLEIERNAIADRAAAAPDEASEFIKWFRDLRMLGPGQQDPLFDWLATEATTSQMTWFIQQEVAGEAGFEDLTALTQIKFPNRPKLEMAQNYWDEMGRGKETGMHGPMLGDVANELGLGIYSNDVIETEPLALANILLGMAVHRQYAYHSVGALGVIELTAPDRALRVHAGLKRLGLSQTGQRYFLLHSKVDIKHYQDWETEVLFPLVEANPQVAVALAEGALMRLNAGARCFQIYKSKLWTTH